MKQACCSGTLSQCNITWKENLSCVAVVMANEGYPEHTFVECVIKGKFAVIVLSFRDGIGFVLRLTFGNSFCISGLPEFADVSDLHVFHACTKMHNDAMVGFGGRVLSVVAVDESLPRASARATIACSKIDFGGCQYRTDIAHKVIPR